MENDPIKAYRQDVEKLARGLYLQALSIKKELKGSRVTEEDKLKILMHCIDLLVSPDK